MNLLSAPLLAAESGEIEISLFGGIILPIIVIMVLVILNGLFVAAEFALVGSRVGRLEAAADRGSGSAQWLVNLFRRNAGKDSYIAVAQLGITIASIGLGMYGEPAVALVIEAPLLDAGLDEGLVLFIGFTIALALITYLHVVLGEMIPKALALQAPESVSIKLNPIMRTFSTLFKPLVYVLNSIAFGLMRLLRIPEPDKKEFLFTSNELAIVADESADSGQLGGLQRDLIRNIFELDERPAEEIMISRPNIVALDKTAGVSEITQVIAGSPRSRYPVIDGDLDHVVGMLHIKDFIRSSQLGNFTSLADIVRPLSVVAAKTTAEDLLEDFKSGNGHAALVVDEHGSTVGFVSLDDVIDEIMEDEESDWLISDKAGVLVVDGEAPITELQTYLADGFEANPEVVTVAGLILDHAGTIPAADAVVVHGEYKLSVAGVEGRKITRVEIVRPT